MSRFSPAAFLFRLSSLNFCVLADLMVLIQLKDIRKSFKIGEQVQEVLKGVNLQIEQGELVSIMGRSGSGKSTLMNILGLLDKPTAGDYTLLGRPVAKLTKNEMAYVRNLEIGFVFQSFFLLPKLTATDNVALPLLYRDMPKAEAREKADYMLEQVGMREWAHHRPSELSGGQQQRVAIARALVGSPKLILADEPTGALDPKIGNEVLELFIRINEQLGATLIIITHDPGVAKRCKRQIMMVEGHLEVQGTV